VRLGKRFNGAMTRLCFVAFLLAAVALGAEPRTWTDVDGRTVEAAFVKIDHDHVKIKRTTDGRIFSLPIARLSPADHAFLKEQLVKVETAAPVESTKEKKPFDGLDWPRRTDLPDDYEVEVIKEDSATNKYIYRTPHFEFHSDVKLARKVVRNFGKIFEGTFEAMRGFPLDWNPQPGESHFKTRLFESRANFLDAGGLPNSGGVYVPRLREIWVPLESLGVEKSSSGYTLDDSDDHSTLSHEITHQVHHDWLDKLPPWMVEGMAVYMESIPNKDGEFRFDKRELDEFVRYRSGASGELVRMVNIERLMTLSHAEWNANFHQKPEQLATYYISAFLLLNYYLHFDGEGEGRRIYAYVRAIEAGQPDAEARLLLLDGRSYAEISEALQRAYDREDIEVLFE